MFKKGDIILLDDNTEVEVVWNNKELIQVAYKDLTKRILIIKNK